MQVDLHLSKLECLPKIPGNCVLEVLNSLGRILRAGPWRRDLVPGVLQSITDILSEFGPRGHRRP
jgi:hypothetical protein